MTANPDKACESLQTDADVLVPVYVAVQVKQGGDWADIAQTETITVRPLFSLH